MPLNDTGRAQAKELAKQLAVEPITAVYTSDLARARETAAIATAGRGLPTRELVDLRERHFGTWEGLTDDVIRDRFPQSRTGPWGDGETIEQMAARVIAALRLIAENHRDATVFISTHGGPMRAALRATGVEPTGPIENCHVLRIEVALNGDVRRLDG